MTLTCDKHAIDIISLRRPTPLDKLADAIPKPKGAIPNFGLPKWKEMPLESKIPMVPGPEGAYNFTRSKIGKRLWISAPDAEFNLNDPYCYEMELSYDSLHDKHLVPYFSRPNNIRHLIKAGLITKNLDAKCSLRDYNMYRKYLRKLHCDSIKEELSKRAKWSNEERAIQYAQEQAQKEVNKLKEKEKLVEKRRAIIRNRELAEKLKRRKQKEKQQKIEERLQALVLKRREAQHLQHIESKARAEMIQQKQKAAAEIERKKIIHTLLDWSRKERIRKRTREIRLAHEQEEKHKTIEQKYMQRWQERLEFQEKQIEKKQFLLQCIESQRKDFIEAYNAKINKETERMKRLLKDVKMFIRCYLARRLPGSKERICCKKYWDEDDGDDDMKHTQLSSTKRYKKTPTTMKDSYPTLMEQDKDKRKKEKVQVKRNITAKVQKELKKKMKKIRPKIKKQKIITDQKGDEKRRKGKGKGKRRRRRRKKLKRETESEEKFESEAEESVSTTKDTEATDQAAADDTLKEKCRCQIIKDVKKAAAT